ncbi:MAG: hypothetical protein JZU53_15150 [Paludibacter sp.]|nr:hypothetical protein [Paludibacter sp.]
MKKSIITVILMTFVVVGMIAQSTNVNKGFSPSKNSQKKGLNAVNEKLAKTVVKDSADAGLRKGWDGTVKGGNIQQSNINSINNGMPNRISMNVTVPKQTQGATFGEKMNAGKINITLVEGGCVVLFSLDEGYLINTANKSIKELSAHESKSFGEKVNAGLHAAGGALAQGASLLGGALPGGAIISAAVSSVGNLAGGAGGGAAAASYAATGRVANPAVDKKVWEIKDDDCDAVLPLSDGDYLLEFVIVEKVGSGLKNTLKTQVKLAFSSISNVLKTKHDTAKNSVGNIR